jgi:alpha-glucosidase
MNTKLLIKWLALWAMTALPVSAKDYTIVSPNGLNVITLDDGINLRISHCGKDILHVKAGLVLSEHGNGKGQARMVNVQAIKSVRKQKVQEENIIAPFYRQTQFHITYQQMDVRLSDGVGMQVRAYDEGVAYRFLTENNKETVILDEIVDFGVQSEAKAWLAYSTNDQKPFAMAFQNVFHETTLIDAEEKHVFLPATIETGNVKVTILESDLRGYPGMFLMKHKGQDGTSLKATFPNYPKKMAYYNWRGMSHVEQTEDYIAKSSGKRTYPWRVMAITENDVDMPVNNMVYALATPNQIGKTDWIKPGKVAWDWWNDWNLTGVDFEAGINTQTYLYYIDFAAKYNIPYVVLDEGWYNSAKGDIMNPIQAIDLQKIIDHGRQKDVGIVLWAVFNVLDEHLFEACEKYAAMGIKGWKVDFLDRNDQTAVEMAERIAKTAANHHLILDYHGFYAPTGMSRTYPNILNYEGVFGMEECRWAKKETDMPRYDVTFPFIRMMAGQVDFTPGAMRNGTKNDWVECYQKPVSMGTRCHQAACYVVHDSPFTMLCDAPTNYEKEPEYTSFIAQIPDEWDETKVLQGELGSYIITARRKGTTWYVGGQTNWDGRTIQLPLNFLNDGPYTVSMLTDGINANHNAEDYRLTTASHHNGEQLDIVMASGGGFVLKITPKTNQDSTR